LIHNLWLDGELVTFDKECYTNLRSLGIGFQSDDCLEDPVETISMDLIKIFPSLVRLHFGSVELTPTAWMAISTHPHIKSLELTAVPIRDVDAPAFWKVCEKLEHLELTYDKLRDLTIPQIQCSIGYAIWKSKPATGSSSPNGLDTSMPKLRVC
jgi:hypothetical protein